MIFGNTAQLAVECVLTPPRTHHMFGRVCMYVGGRQLGDFSAVVALGGPVDFFRRSLTFARQHTDEIFLNKTSAEIIPLVYGFLYENSDDSLVDQVALERRYRKFVLMPNGCESFDGEFALLVDDRHGQRFIHKWGAEIQEILLPEAYYELVISEFLSWVDGLKHFAE